MSYLRRFCGAYKSENLKKIPKSFYYVVGKVEVAAVTIFMTFRDILVFTAKRGIEYTQTDEMGTQKRSNLQIGFHPLT